MKKQFYLLVLTLLATANVWAQNRLTGRITDSGNALPGVSVLVKGTNTGTNSDSDGKFSLSVPSNATIVVSFIGYSTQEIAVGNRSNIDISLLPDIKTLNEVVVTGYGVQSKRDITGAVSSIDSKQLLNVPAANLGQALQGKVTGVTVGNDNSPGGGVSVRIRGFGTINDNSPLYVIDGVPTKGNLATLNVNDIESMQILKDASASSIYGSRAGNGVVIITTRKGKGGKPTFTYDSYYGQQTPGRTLDLLNSDEYLKFYWEGVTRRSNESALVDGKLPATPTLPNVAFFGGQTATPSLPDFYVLPVGRLMEGDARANPDLYNYNTRYLITKVNKEGTNWLKEIFKSAPLQNHQIGVSGATENARYAISANYFDQKGIMQYNGLC